MATTYNDQKSALDALTNSLVFENTTRAITGTGHNAQELGQNSSAFDNLVAYDNYAYKVVRTYATATENGQSLKDAYEDAKTLTPSGAALATNNRVALLIPPGTYSFGTDGLELDTQFIDLIGVGKAEETILTSVSNTGTGLGTIIQTTNDIIFKNLTIQNTANTYDTGTDQDDSGYAPQNVFPSARFEDCIFRNADGILGAPFMRLDFEYSGTFIRCRGIDPDGISVFCAGATGNYFDCHYSGSGFGAGREASGIFTDCSCLYGFGNAADASGSFTRCTAFNSGFGNNGGVASGSFSYCTALTRSFGHGAGGCSGTFINCRATDVSFGSSTNTAVFIDCQSGNNSFGSVSSANELAGSYRNCVAGASSFGRGSGSELSGTFVNCQAGGNSFGSATGAVLSGVFDGCFAGNDSFGSGAGAELSGTFSNCRAGDRSIGYSSNIAQPALLSGVFRNCSAGDSSIGGLYAEYDDGARFYNCVGAAGCFQAIPTTDVGCEFYNCSCTQGFDFNTKSSAVLKDCSTESGGFGSGLGLTLAGTYINCSCSEGFCVGGGDGAVLSGVFENCRTAGLGFGSGPGNPGDGDHVLSGSFINCSSGDNSFGYCGSDRGAELSGYFKNCRAGNDSFGSNVSLALSGLGDIIMSGTFEDCSAGDNSFGCTNGFDTNVSFAGKAYNCTAGNFSFCTAVETPGAGSHTESLGGYLENCHAGPGSFAAHSTSIKLDDLRMNNCSVRPSPDLSEWRDQGFLEGIMTDCKWLAPAASFAAVPIAPGAKIYGGIYRAGSGAASSIIITSPGTASIANVLLNAPLDGSITNNISSPNVIVDSDI